MARNVVHVAVGEAASETPSLTRLYLVFDLVSLLLLVLAGVGVGRAHALWRHRLRPPHPTRALVGILLRVVGVALLVLAPVLLGGWSAAWTWAPDLGLVIVFLAGLIADSTAFRVAALLRHSAGSATSPTEGNRHVLAGDRAPHQALRQ
jgi:hypothetical protein